MASLVGVKRGKESGRERGLRIFGPDYLQADQVIQLFVANRLKSWQHVIQTSPQVVQGFDFKRNLAAQAFN